MIAPGAEPSHGGEANTLVDLYSKHERRIYRYCLALLRNPDDAEDATQETFTRAAPFLPNLAGDLSAYLTTVARNICCDVVRARSKRPVPLDNVALADRAVSPERQSIDWDVVRRMWRQLSPSERLLFAYTFAGYRYEEIASRTGMSRPSVSVGLTRARRRLRELATAIGALGLLPLGVRRLIDRVSRRANALLTSGQQTLIDMAQQTGAVVGGLLAGLITLGATGPGPVVAAPALALASHRQLDAPSAPALIGQSPRVSPTAAGVPAATGAPGPHGSPGASGQAGPPVVGQVSGTLFGGTATPSNTGPHSTTASPGFSRDRVIFMTGLLLDCQLPSCEAVFRSNDAGSTWARIWPETNVAGSVLLPPQFPQDPTVFMLAGAAGLFGGTSDSNPPSLLIPGANTAAIAPDSPAGRAHIAAATVHGVIETYTMGDAAPLPGPPLPAGMIPNSIVFTDPGRVLVAGYEVSPSGTQQAVLVRCTLATTCAGPAVFASDTSLQLATPRAYGNPVLAYSWVHALLSTDGGASFHQVFQPPAGMVVETAGIGTTPSGIRLVASDSDAATQTRTTAAYSDDLGTTWTDASGDLVAHGFAVQAEVLDNANLLLTLTHMGSNVFFAIQETTGNGHWGYPQAF